MRITLQNLHRDPGLRIALYTLARRDRAQAIHRLIIAPLKAFLAGPPRQPSRMLRRRAAFG
jgi:hypothetical protein